MTKNCFETEILQMLFLISDANADVNFKKLIMDATVDADFKII